MRERYRARGDATILELTMDTLTAFHDLGRANALEALAQVGGFRDLTDAVANHYQNLADTLTEMHAPPPKPPPRVMASKRCCASAVGKLQPPASARVRRGKTSAGCLQEDAE
jgi:hypothetical protein